MPGRVTRGVNGLALRVGEKLTDAGRTGAEVVDRALVEAIEPEVDSDSEQGKPSQSEGEELVSARRRAQSVLLTSLSFQAA